MTATPAISLSTRPAVTATGGIRRPKPTDCHHRYPRLDRDCDRSADYVIDYARGVGACAEHLGKELAWVMEDSSTAQVYRVEMWIHLHPDDDAQTDAEQH